MMVLAELLPGWPATTVRALCDAGAIPRWDGLPLGRPVLRTDPRQAQPGDHVRVKLSDLPVAEGLVPWVVCSTPQQVGEAAAAGAHLWLRGQEVGDNPSPPTALVLIRAAAAAGAPFAVEGLGPAAMAAALAVGAAGVVLTAELWGIAGTGLHPEHLRRLVGPADTVTRGERGRRLAHGPQGPVAPDWHARVHSAIPAPQSLAQARRFWEMSEPAEVVRHLRSSFDRHRAAAADPRLPPPRVVQGPMANVAEGPALASAVSAAGGLPFVALGALRPADAATVLEGVAALCIPYGAGLIGFDVMPHRDAHIALLEEIRPDAVLIAGGSPALASRLQDKGLDVWLHTPSPGLMKLALRRGVSTLVLEGREAGGHVGTWTSAGLWELGLEAAEAHLDRGGSPVSMVLAGGIGDAVSAAFAVALLAPVLQRGVALSVQAGTAFLLTEEARAAEQVTAAYQQAALAATTTVLVGESANLPLRCAPNAFTELALGEEVRWRDRPLRERRERLESLNLGRTRLAAKGIERHPGHGAAGVPRYRRVPAERIAGEGAHTVGQGVLVSNSVRTVGQVVRSLSQGAMALLRPSLSPWGPPRAVTGTPVVPSAPVTRPGVLRRAGATPADRLDGIAIVGLGCVLPGAPDLPSFWRLLRDGHCAIRRVPPNRWDAGRYYDPLGGTPTSSTSQLAGWIDGPDFDAASFRIPPRAAIAMDRAQQLALLAARQCVEGGWQQADPLRSAVILGNSMGGENAKDMTLRVRFGEVIDALIATGATGGDRAAVEAMLEQALPISADTMSGLLSNVIAGRITSWLDWRGGNLTVDAACASALAALDSAVAQLRSGRLDVVLTGGVDTDLSIPTFAGFSRTEALSSGTSRPFSLLADGFVMGEGAVVLALKRLADAERDGDPVWAVLRGLGQSSDGRGRGITAPHPEGQRLAVERAWSEAALSPSQAAFVEAHGTGTAIGDPTELAVLAEVFGEGDAPVWVGSAKSNLGHLKGAAGAVGLAKATLALASGVLPPTVHAHPSRELPGRLRLTDGCEPLQDGALAGVSAFGFGGTNFHAVLQAPPVHLRPPAHATWLASPAPLPRAEWHCRWVLEAYGADDEESLLQDLRAGLTVTAEVCARSAYRAVWVRGVEDNSARDRAVGALTQGRTHPRLFVGRGEQAPLFALCPGQGAQRDGDWASAARHPAAAAVLQSLGPAPASDATAPLALHRRLFPLSVAWAARLRQLEAPLHGAIGHSLGEYAALVAAGWTTAAALWPAVQRRGELLEGAKPGSMVSLALPVEQAEALARRHHLALAAHNGPTAAVLCGPEPAVASLLSDAELAGVRAARLDVSRAFHHPDLVSVQPALHRALREVAFTGGVPVYSGADGAAFATDPRPQLVGGLASPVQFVEALAKVPQHAAFVEIGPGRTLCNAVRGLRADAVTIPLDPSPTDGGEGWTLATAALLAAGYPEPARERVVGPRRHRQSPESAPLPVPEPSAGEPAATTGDEEPGSVRDAVIDALVDVSGYDRQTLEKETGDLEAELGIDSIRKLEVLGALEDRFGFTTPEADYAELSGITLEGLVAHVEGQLGGEALAEQQVGAPSGWLHVHGWLGAGAPLPPRRAHREAPRLTAERARTVCLEACRGADAAPHAVIDPDDPARAALAGFLRGLARERGAPLRLVFSPHDGLEVDTGHEEVRHADGAPATPVLLPAAPAGSLPTGAVWLVTGGLTGILGPILGALAPVSPIIIALGRREQTEVAHAIEALRELGLTLHYRRCDLTDDGAVTQVLGEIRDRFGRIDVVLHGAGALRDGPVAELTEEDLDAVLGPKLFGAAHLMEATRADELTLWAAISSVVARRGNPGQTVYGAANAVLEAWPHPTARRSVTVASTAWSEVGMAADPRLQAVLRRRGLTPLTPREGGARFVEALTVDSPVVTLAQAEDTTLTAPLGPALVFHQGSRGAFAVPLSPAHPGLADHRIRGRALVPAAWWLTAMERALSLTAGSTGPWSLQDFTVLAPTFVERERTDVTLHLERGDGWRLTVCAGATPVATATARRTVLGEDARPPGAPALSAKALYREDMLFHGPSWRVLRTVDGDGNGHVRARVTQTDTGVGAVAEVVDGVYQLLAAWSGRTTGFTGLPVGARRWDLGHLDPGEAVHLVLDARATDEGASAQVVGHTASGRWVLTGQDVMLRRAGRWPADAPDLFGGSRG